MFWNFSALILLILLCFFFSSRRRHTRCSRDWSSDVCSSDLLAWRRPRRPPGVLRLGTMEAKNADLSALRIDRAADAAAPLRGLPRWLVVGLPAGAVVLVAILLLTTGALGSAVPVQLAPATMVSPIRSGAVLIASGYVVAQRKAAVASKGTGRLVYLGVVEGDRVRTG